MRRGLRGLAGIFLAIAVGSFAANTRPVDAIAAPLSPRQQGEDFDAMWRAVNSGYAYFDRGHAEWQRARDKWRPRAARATTRGDFVASLEGALAELRDDNVDLSEHSPGFGRRVPYETDIFARWKDGAAVIEAVRTYSDADVAGLRPGLVITKVDNVPIARAAPGDRELRHVLAGPRVGIQRLELRDAHRVYPVAIEHGEGTKNAIPPVVGRRMGEQRDIGYLRVRIGAGDPKLRETFDGAFEYLKGTRATIFDLRETAGPGPRDLTEAILAKPFRKPLVVLVDRWTAGEAELIAATLAANGAQLVGTPTAGLHGRLMTVTLPNSAIVVSFPGEKSTHETPLTPSIPIDLAAPSGGPGDPILYQALKLLEKH